MNVVPGEAQNALAPELEVRIARGIPFPVVGVLILGALAIRSLESISSTPF